MIVFLVYVDLSKNHYIFLGTLQVSLLSANPGWDSFEQFNTEKNAFFPPIKCC